MVDRDARVALSRPSSQSFDLSSQTLEARDLQLSRQLTLPNNEYSPPERSQLRLLTSITLLVRNRLLLPELSVRSRPTPKPAVVSVPEAAVHEDDGPVPWEHQVGPTWKTATTQPVSKTASVECFANKHLECRVLLPHTAHALGTLLGGQGIGHASILRSGGTDQGMRGA